VGLGGCPAQPRPRSLAATGSAPCTASCEI
jgi:hypothetical protein